MKINTRSLYILILVFLIILAVVTWLLTSRSNWQNISINGYIFQIPVSWSLGSEPRGDNITLWSLSNKDKSTVITITNTVAHPSFDLEGVSKPTNEKYLEFINKTVPYSITSVADQQMYTFYEYDDCSEQTSLVKRTCPPNSNYFNYSLRDFLGYDEASFAIFLDKSIADKDSSLSEALTILKSAIEATKE